MASIKSKDRKRSASRISSYKSTKSRKSTRSSKVELKIPDAWLNELETLQINDLSWNCLVALIIEQCSNMTVYTDHFNEAAIDGSRLAVRAISTMVVARTVTKNMVDESSGRQVTPMALLCSEIYKKVGPDFQDNVPKELLAPLIKYIILEYKEWNKKVREGIKSLEKGIDDFQQGMWSLPNKLGKIGKSQETSVKTDKTSKSIKPFTKLRRRGDSWKDVQWIDDSPLDGPNLYIVLSTFYDADLILELLKFGIPLQAVLKMELMKTPIDHKWPRSSSNTQDEDMPQCLADFKRKSLPFIRTSIKSKKLSSARLNKITSDFWNRLEYLKTNLSHALLYKDIMFLTYDPQNNDFRLVEFKENIYKEITHFLYDAFEITRHHKSYLKDMKIMDLSDHNICLRSEMKTYNAVLDIIPHEVLTIPLILEALLAEICITDRSIESIPKEEEETLLPRNEIDNTNSESTINDNLLKLLDSLNLKYDLSCDHPVKLKPRALSASSTEKIQAFKKIMQYSDDIKLKTFHLDSELADFIINRSICVLKTAWKSMLDMKCVSYNRNSRFNKLCNEITKFHQETNHISLYYYVYLLIINNVLDCLLLQKSTSEPNQASLRSKNSSVLCEECKKDCGVNGHFRHSTISKNTQSSDGMDENIIASDMFFIEDMSTDILLQNIQFSCENYNWLEKRYCPYTDRLVLIFHNLPHYFEEQWMGKLTTPVPLKDFVDYILDEEKIWHKEFILEKCEGLIPKIASRHANFQRESQLLRKIQDISGLDMEFISHRSLKYEAMMKQTKNQIASRKSSFTATSTLRAGKKKSISSKKGESKESGDLKRKEERLYTNKDITERLFFEDNEYQGFKFFGYDQGEPMRFQFNGTKKSKALGRNCRVTLDTLKKLYGMEYIRLNIKICGHNLYYSFNPKSNSITPFHLVLSSGIVLYFGSPCSEISPSETTFQRTQSSKITQTQEPPKSDARSISEQDGSEMFTFLVANSFHTPNYFLNHVKECRYYNVPYLYELKISTPLGLHVELEEGINLLYVRQTQLSTPFVCTTHGQEKFRCCLSTGFILKFFDNGKVVALGPNGDIYTIYHNSVYTEGSHEDLVKELFSEVLSKVSVSHRDTKNSISTKSRKNKLNAKSKRKSSESYNDSAPEHPKASHTQSQFTNLLVNTYDYNFTTSDGKQYEIRGPTLKPLENLLVTSHPDITNNCISSERSDQVTTKHMGDGSLVVKYPDGSQVTSIPIESEDIFVEWSTEELIRWFIPSEHSISQVDIASKESSIVGKSQRSSNKGINLNLNDSFKEKMKYQNENPLTEDDVSSTKNSNAGKSHQSSNNGLNLTLNDSLKEKNEIQNENSLMENNYSFPSNKYSCTYKKLNYSQDGFVVYNISYRLEHANFGLIYFDSNNCQIDFELPQSTRVTLKNDGSYKANFDSASLTVDKTKIHFNEHNEAGGIERTTVIDKSNAIVNTANVIDQENSTRQSLPETIEGVQLRSLIGKDIAVGSVTRKDFEVAVFYSEDCFGNEMYIDCNLKFHNVSQKTGFNKITGNDLACFVIDRDLKGFRIINDDEANEYIDYVAEKKGLVRENKDEWNSILTSITIDRNELEKWLMTSEKDGSSRFYDIGNSAYSISTYGRRESWFQPFKEKPEVSAEEFQVPSDVIVVRLLRKIETDNFVLNCLHNAIEAFKKTVQFTQPLRTTLEEPRGYLNIDDIIQDPDILKQIYKEEKTKKFREEDKVREQMKNIVTGSLVRQACIRSRNLRLETKVEQMKTIYRNKTVPPYYWSCFGSVHNILNEVIERVYEHHKAKLTEETRQMIISIVDSILNNISKEKTTLKSGDTDSEITLEKKESAGMSDLVTEILEKCYSEISIKEKEHGIMSDLVREILEKCYSEISIKKRESTKMSDLVTEILENCYGLNEERNEEKIVNVILEKPLSLLTLDEVDLLCKMFESQPKKCPILVSEEVILQDVLEARHQLSHYFSNLREMLECYRMHTLYLC